MTARWVEHCVTSSRWSRMLSRSCGVWSLTMRPAYPRRVAVPAAVPSIVLAILLGSGLVTACVPPANSTGLSTASMSASEFRGDALGVPEVLTAAVSGVELRSGSAAVTLGQLQRKHPVLLLYFGYTTCPDVCPATMADIGIALRQLPVAAQQLVQVVFVTSDPARDTAAVLEKWVANFDAGLALPFIGLRGTVQDIDSVGNALGVPLRPPATQADGSIDVEHGTQVLAFVHGTARLAWLADTTSDDYAHDLTLLTRPLGG
jgi:protein SCO1/2